MANLGPSSCISLEHDQTTATELSKTTTDRGIPNSAPFFIRGKVIEGADQIHRSRDLGVDFATPEIDLDSSNCVTRSPVAAHSGSCDSARRGPSTIGNPHDAMYPLHPFVHWMANEDGIEGQ